jgi:hypothetical protein
MLVGLESLFLPTRDETCNLRGYITLCLTLWALFQEDRILSIFFPLSLLSGLCQCMFWLKVETVPYHLPCYCHTTGGARFRMLKSFPMSHSAMALLPWKIIFAPRITRWSKAKQPRTLRNQVWSVRFSFMAFTDVNNRDALLADGARENKWRKTPQSSQPPMPCHWSNSNPSHQAYSVPCGISRFAPEFDPCSNRSHRNRSPCWTRSSLKEIDFIASMHCRHTLYQRAGVSY